MKREEARALVMWLGPPYYIAPDSSRQLDPEALYRTERYNEGCDLIRVAECELCAAIKTRLQHNNLHVIVHHEPMQCVSVTIKRQDRTLLAEQRRDTEFLALLEITKLVNV